MSTDFLLWQWSLITQLVSGAMICGFFLIFGRDVRTAEMRAWTLAWIANFAALLVTFFDVYWVDGTTGPAFAAVSAGYVAAKALFVIGILEGLQLAIDVDRPRWSSRTRAIVVAVLALASAITVHSFTALGLIAQGLVGVAFSVGAWIAWRRVGHPVRWLSIGLALRAALGLAEMFAYVTEAIPSVLLPSGGRELLASFLAVSSFFDTTTEWLLALGCVLAATTRAQRELRYTNDDLLLAQEALRAIVDVDPLTGLANRRALPGLLRTVQPDGASLVFIDLRDFKQVNDARGHAAGDDFLKRFASALQESFRPGDAIVRYAGDEFLVVAQGLERAAMEARIVKLRARLADGASGWSSRITFDAGHSELGAGGHPDDAVQAADRAMYEAKLYARGDWSDAQSH